jgi:GT2 family glycosyltransferase
MLNISIVLYQPHWEQIKQLTQILLECRDVHSIYWIDNSPIEHEQTWVSDKVRYIFNNKNLGYGTAHNIAIRESIYDDIPFHLVINPDILLTSDVIDTLLHFIQHYPEVGLVAPRVEYPTGELQYLCKLLPTPWDVFGRRFLPRCWMKKRNECYELRQSGYNQIMNVPYLSGCFMLLRTEAVRRVRLFDERFFMYPEDIDLTRRIHRNYLTVFFPHVRVIHNHTRASYKSLKMLCIHIINMCRYFNKWGWIVDKERDLFNQQTKQAYIKDKKS